ncbi:MAG: hypothetical protein K5643_08185 [Saccharofermentans sp.]|nr:hypothetical protein [Saccharofermentans sp.]
MSLEHKNNLTWDEEYLYIVIPEYLDELARKYNLRFKVVSCTETAMYNEDCCLLIGVDNRDGIILSTVVNDNGKKVEYSTNIFFRVSIDDSDTEGLDLSDKHLNVIIRNDLIILSRNLDSKWSKYLQGDMSWLEDYKKCSSYYEYHNYMEDRNKRLDEIIAWQQEQRMKKTISTENRDLLRVKNDD